MSAQIKRRNGICKSEFVKFLRAFNDHLLNKWWQRRAFKIIAINGSCSQMDFIFRILKRGTEKSSGERRFSRVVFVIGERLLRGRFYKLPRVPSCVLLAQPGTRGFDPRGAKVSADLEGVGLGGPSVLTGWTWARSEGGISESTVSPSRRSSSRRIVPGQRSFRHMAASAVLVL
jgi:hypothetical protein